MIIEYLKLMWVRLFIAGYRPPGKKPEPETLDQYFKRAKETVGEKISIPPKNSK